MRLDMFVGPATLTYDCQFDSILKWEAEPRAKDADSRWSDRQLTDWVEKVDGVAGLC